MSFKRPKVTVDTSSTTTEAEAPNQGVVATTTARKKRLASGGVQGTFLGSMANAALAGPGPTLTGVG